MGLFKSKVQKLAESGDLTGIVMLLGDTGKDAQEATVYLAGMGEAAGPALLGRVLADTSFQKEQTFSSQVGAALALLERIPDYTFAGCLHVLETESGPVYLRNAADTYSWLVELQHRDYFDAHYMDDDFDRDAFERWDVFDACPPLVQQALIDYKVPWAMTHWWQPES